MSIFDNIKDVLGTAAGYAGHEIEDVGKTLSASFVVPVGLAYDIATSPGDTPKDVLQAGGKFLSWESSLFTDTQAGSGKILEPVMHGLDWAKSNIISEPIATAVTMASHLDSGSGNTHYGDLFSGQAWSHAYKIAQTQSIGQSVVFAVSNSKDPFDYKLPYEQTVHRDHPTLATLASGSFDFAVTWRLDPGILLGKGAGAAKRTLYTRPITESELPHLQELSQTERSKKYGLPFFHASSEGLADRFDHMFGTLNPDGTLATPGFIKGKSQPEILAGLGKTLDKDPNGAQIAGLFAQIGRIQNDAERINTAREVQLALLGDTSTIVGLRKRQAFVAQQLDNLAKGTVGANANGVWQDSLYQTYLDRGLRPPVLPRGSSPVAIAEAETKAAQIPDLETMLNNTEQRLNMILGTPKGGQPGMIGSMRSVPRIGARENRLLGRYQGHGLLRDQTANSGHPGLDKALDGALNSALPHITRPIETLYQYNTSSQPLRVIHALAIKAPLLAAKGIGKATMKAPVILYDNFNNARPEGFINTNDSDNSVRQLDAFLRKVGASQESRAKYGEQMALANSPSERRAVLAAVAGRSTAWLMNKHGIEDADEFAQMLGERGVKMGESVVAALNGRAYSATDRAKSDYRVFKAVWEAKKRGEEPQWKELRVDQIDDDGVAVALPFLETQDASLFVMPDVNVIDSFMKRHTGLVRAVARKWTEDQMYYKPELDAYVRTRAGHVFESTLDRYERTSDFVLSFLDEASRFWKFQVLLRLGYPMRVIMDDHLRALAAMGAMVSINGLKQGVSNTAYNYFGPRWRENNNVRKDLIVELETLEDHIPTEEMLDQNRLAYSRLAQIERKLRKPEPTPIYHGSVSEEMAATADETYGKGITTTLRPTSAAVRSRQGPRTSDEPTYLYEVKQADRTKVFELNRRMSKKDAQQLSMFLRSEGLDSSAEAVDRRFAAQFRPGDTADEIARQQASDPNYTPLPDYQPPPMTWHDVYEGLGPDKPDPNLINRYLAETKGVHGIKISPAHQEGRVHYFSPDVLEEPRLVTRVDDAMPVGDLDHLMRVQAPRGGVKSETRREELIAERAAILDAHPEDLSTHAARMEEIKALLNRHTYANTNKRRIGQENVEVDGHTFEGLYAGTYGDDWRKIMENSSTIDRLGSMSERDRYAKLSRSHSWRVVDPKEGTQHLAAWEYAINNHIRRSELARILLKGGNADDIVKFLKSTPRGRELVRQFPYNGGEPEQWAVNIEKMVDEYLPTERLRQIAKDRPVTARELDAMPEFQDINMRPRVHGYMLDKTLESGSVAARVNRVYGRFYNFVGRVNDTVSRHPITTALYDHELERLARIEIDVAKKQGRHLTNEDLQQISHRARIYAKKYTNRLLFEMGSTTEMAHFMRFIAPFFGAWQEALNRWWRILADKPEVARKFFLGFDGPRRAGFVTDRDGNVVPPGSNISDEHYYTFQLPFGWLGGTRFRLAESSFNLVTQGGGILNPGFGPIVQLPVGFVARNDPENARLQAFAKVILPTGTGKSAADLGLASSLRSAYTIASAYTGHNTRQLDQFAVMEQQRLAVEFELQHGRPPTLTEQNKIIEEAQDRARILAITKFATSLVSPAAMQPESKFAPQLQAFRRLQEYAQTHNKDDQWAYDKFVAEYGEAYFPLVKSASSNPAGIYESVGSVAQIKRYRGLLNQIDPRLYRGVIGQAGDMPFDQTAYNYLATHQLRPGSNDAFVQQNNPRDALTEQLVAQGRYDYNKLMNKLMSAANAMGLPSYLQSTQLLQVKREEIAKLAKGNEAWWQDYSTYNPAEYESTLEGLNVVAKYPSLMKNPQRTDIFALQNYLTLRSTIQSQLELRGAQGGSSTPTANSNADLMTAFRNGMSQIVESNTQFANYWFNGIIERDPYVVAATGSNPQILERSVA